MPVICVMPGTPLEKNLLNTLSKSTTLSIQEDTTSSGKMNTPVSYKSEGAGVPQEVFLLH